MNLHVLNLQATHTAILRSSVEGFNSFRQSVSVWLQWAYRPRLTKSDPPAQLQRKQYKSSSPDLL